MRHANPSPEQITKALIQAITEERKAQGLTYEQLADRAGVHRTTIALWEREERTPTIQLALQLASALNVPLSLLLARCEAACQTGQSVVSLSHRRLWRNISETKTNCANSPALLTRPFEGRSRTVTKRWT